MFLLRSVTEKWGQRYGTVFLSVRPCVDYARAARGARAAGDMHVRGVYDTRCSVSNRNGARFEFTVLSVTLCTLLTVLYCTVRTQAMSLCAHTTRARPLTDPRARCDTLEALPLRIPSYSRWSHLA